MLSNCIVSFGVRHPVQHWTFRNHVFFGAYQANRPRYVYEQVSQILLGPVG